MFKFLVVIAAFVPAILGQALPVGQCVDRGVHPESVTVQGCTSLPCDVRRGDTANMYQTFIANRPIQSFEPIVRAIAAGVTIGYPLDDSLRNGCADLQQGSCPIDAGERVVYNFRFFLEANYPLIPVTVELTLTEPSGAPISCFTLPIHVRA